MAAPATARGARIRFLEEMECAILSSHRSRPPRGLDGGGDGQAGSTEVRRLDGRIETLRACDQTVLEAGEAVIVTTPTPGGFGQDLSRVVSRCHLTVTRFIYPLRNPRAEIIPR